MLGLTVASASMMSVALPSLSHEKRTRTIVGALYTTAYTPVSTCAYWTTTFAGASSVASATGTPLSCRAEKIAASVSCLILAKSAFSSADFSAR